MKRIFKVIGLDCSEEISILKKILMKKDRIIDLEFDLFHGKMTVKCAAKLDPKNIIQWIKEEGMEAFLCNDCKRFKEGGFWQKWGRLIGTVLSGAFLIMAIVFDARGNAISERLYFLATVCGAYFVVPKAFRAIKRFQPDMNVLMFIAILGALRIGQWFEGAAVAFLFSVSLLLEHWSLARARRAVRSLLNLTPKMAHLVDQGEKKVEEINIGDRILVRPGEKIPLDGILEKGSTSINQAPITGESIPVWKKRGDKVYAGTINQEGAIECIVTKKSEDTTLAQIVNLIKEARSKRARVEQWIEKFAKIYTPLMMGVAAFIAAFPPLLFGFNWEDWVYKGLVILVIACPCALVISTPVSIVSGLTAAARLGILIKGGIYLEIPRKLGALALDKTGTLTYGRPKVQKIIPLNGHTEKELLERAAALEAPSEHPLAGAILKYAAEKGVKKERATHFRIIKGKGGEGIYLGKRYWIGSRRFMCEMKQETFEIHQMALDLEDASHSVIAIGNNRHVCGLISVADQPRKNLKFIIQEIKKAGVENVVMLTGDSKKAAEAISHLSGVDKAEGELLPQDKVKAIEQLKKKWGYVAMIGDGINDAPAMAAASFGVAMGTIGTDVAIETADITLIGDDLSKIPWLIRHSRKTVQIIQQNLFFSFGIKALFFVLAILGTASLWMAILADAGASLLVVFNGLRLLNGRYRRIDQFS